MYKLIYINSVDFPKPLWIKDLGGYNNLPTPNRQCSKHEWFHKAGSYLPKFIEFRQVYLQPNNKGPIKSCHIYWFDDTAFVVFYPNKWHCGKDEFNMDSVIWDEDCIYYRVGCEHKQSTSKTLGNCWYSYTCKDCGYSWEVDSSD